ncbi:MAG: hypothetical protein ABFQ89_02090 [Chloroflexota bacterium]
MSDHSSTQRLFVYLTLLSLVICNHVLNQLPEARAESNDPEPSQSITAPETRHPSGQKVSYQGQTGGLIYDFAFSGDLGFVPEGEALTILQVQKDDVTVLSRISPNQGRINGIAVDNDFAYLITTTGMVIVDVSDPALPQIRSIFPGGGEQIQLMNGFALVVAREAGLRVVMISDPDHPKLSGALDLPGSAVALELDEESNIAYVASDSAGLLAIDVRSPDFLRVIAHLELEDGAQEVALRGNLLAVSSGDRMVMVEIGESALMEDIGYYAPPRRIRRVTTSYSTAYAADIHGGLKIYDIADPSHPHLIYGEFNHTSFDITVDNYRAYLADGVRGVRIMDISRRSAPREISHIELRGKAQGITKWDQYLLVAAGQNGLYIYNIANETQPRLVGHLDTDGDARDVVVSDWKAYVADGPAGLAIISIARPHEPRLLSTIFAPSEAQAVDVYGSFVHIAVDDGGMAIVDAIRPSAPTLVGTLALPDGERAVDISIQQKRAYLAIIDDKEQSKGIAICDVGLRTRPSILARVPGPGFGVAVQDRLLVTVGGRELMTVNVRSSSGPERYGLYRAALGAGGISLQNSILLFSAASEGPELTLLDISDPVYPREIYQYDQTPAAGAVAVVNNQVVVATGHRGLRWYGAPSCPTPCDLQTPNYDPLHTLSQVYSLDQYPEYIFGTGETGWSIADVSDPNLPQPVSWIHNDSRATGMVVEDSFLYLAAGVSGLEVYRLSEEDHHVRPELMSRLHTGTSVQDVMIHHDHLYILDQQKGLRIVRVDPPHDLQIMQTVPLSITPKSIVALPRDSDHIDALAYILGESGLVQLVTLGNPTLGIHELDNVVTSANQFSFDCQDTCDSPVVLAIDGDGLQVLSYDPNGTVSTSSIRVNGDILHQSGDKAFVGSSGGHVTIIDLVDPKTPSPVGMMGNGAPVSAMAYIPENDRFFVSIATADSDMIRTWDISDPPNPVSEGSISCSRISQMALTEDKTGLIAVGEHLIHYSLTQAVTPTLVHTYSLPASALSLDVSNDLILVGTLDGLGLFAISNTGVGELGWYPTYSAVTSIARADSRAFLILEDGSGLVIDISSPSSPALLSAIPQTENSSLLQTSTSGHYLMTLSTQGLSRFDISDSVRGPTVLPMAWPNEWQPSDLEIKNDRAIITDFEQGAAIFDISEPSSPTVMGFTDTPGQAHSLDTIESEEGVVVADGECGVRVISLMDPSQPIEVGYWQSGYALDVAAKGDQIFVADVSELISLEFNDNMRAHLPAAPQNPSPINGAHIYPATINTGYPFTVTLEWGPENPVCDPLVYDLYLGTSQPPPLVAENLTTLSFDLTGLDLWNQYYWYVVARDRQGDSVKGPVWEFTIRTEAQPPAVDPHPIPQELIDNDRSSVILVSAALAIAGLLLFTLSHTRSRVRPD